MSDNWKLKLLILFCILGFWGMYTDSRLNKIETQLKLMGES